MSRISLKEILSAGYTAGWEEVGREEATATDITVFDGKYSLLCKATVNKKKRIWAVGRDTNLEPCVMERAAITFAKLSDGVDTIFRVVDVTEITEA